MRKRYGFTLAELLIVVAIIAVLVAVSIPVLNDQLEKAREAVDLANLRVALEEVSKATLDPSYLKETVTDPYSEVTCEDSVYSIRVRITQKEPKWQSYGNADTAEFAGNPVDVPNVGDTAYWLVQLKDKEQIFVINKVS